MSLGLLLPALCMLVVLLFGITPASLTIVVCVIIILYLHREVPEEKKKAPAAVRPATKPPPPVDDAPGKKKKKHKLVKNLCFPMKIRDTQSDADIACQNITCNGKPVPIENQYFRGQALVKMRSPTEEYMEPAIESFFAENAKARFELQVQGVFKSPPPGMVYMGAEVKNSLELGRLSKGVAKAVIRIMKSIVSGLHNSFGEDEDVDENPHLAMPLAAVMHYIIETPAGDTPPPLDGSKFPDTTLDRKTVEWTMGSTWSFGFYSGNLDFLGQKVVNIPGLGDQDLTKFVKQPISLFAYYLGEGHNANYHLKSEKNYCFCFELEHTQGEMYWEEKWEEVDDEDDESDEDVASSSTVRPRFDAKAEILITGWIEQPGEGPLFVVQINAAMSGSWSVIRSYADFDSLDRQHERTYKHVMGHKRPPLSTSLPRKSQSIDDSNSLERFLQSLIAVGTKGKAELEAILEAFLVSGTPTSDCMYIGADVNMACPYRHSHTFRPYDRIPTQSQQAPEKKWKAVLHSIKQHTDPKNINKIRKERKRDAQNADAIMEKAPSKHSPDRDDSPPLYEESETLAPSGRRRRRKRHSASGGGGGSGDANAKPLKRQTSRVRIGSEKDEKRRSRPATSAADAKDA